MTDFAKFLKLVKPKNGHTSPMPTKTKVPNISAARRPQHQANIKPKSEETTLARSQDSQLAARSCGAYRRYTMELDEQLLQQDVVE